MIVDMQMRTQELGILLLSLPPHNCWGNKSEGNPTRVQPDTYHARLGLKLDATKSKVYKQLEETAAYANANEMKINTKKCKFMVFNPTTNYVFVPELQIEGKDIDTV